MWRSEPTMDSLESLADKFIKLTKNLDLFPEIFNISIFTPPLSDNIDTKYYQDHSPTPYLIAMRKDKPSLVFLTDDQFKNVAKIGFIRYWKSPKFLIENNKKVNYYLKNLDDFYSRYNYSYIQKNNLNKLIVISKKTFNANRHLNSLIWFSIYDINEEFIYKLLDKFHSKLSLEKIKATWTNATTAHFASFEKRRRIILLNLIAKDTPWQEITEKCQYFYANYNHIDNSLEVRKKLFQQYGKISKIKARQLIKKIGDEEKRNISTFQNWLKTLDQEEQKLVNFLQNLIRLRDIRKDGICKALTIIYRITQRLFKEAGIDEKLIPYYSSFEVTKGLNYLIKHKDEINKRPDGIAMIWDMRDKSPVEFEYGSYAQTKQKLESYYLKRALSTRLEDELKGQIACRGKVRGKVKIVYNPSQENFKMGEILVTGMTRPEFVPLMKKAAAIITNEGGITTHAAIVSRELNIPCIMGTKVATQVLKDGDLVEVDANVGKVIILERDK